MESDWKQSGIGPERELFANTNSVICVSWEREGMEEERELASRWISLKAVRVFNDTGSVPIRWFDANKNATHMPLIRICALNTVPWVVDVTWITCAEPIL